MDPLALAKRWYLQVRNSMKIKNTNPHENEATASRRLPWDADNTTPGGPTSLDILQTWLTTPGKYKRLHSEQRSQAVQNILGSLMKNGIKHRSDSSVRSKVRSIEDQYVTAKSWLEERNINGDDVVKGKVDRDTEAQVLAICPFYCDLMPVFRHSSYLNDMVPIHEKADTDFYPEDGTDFKSAKQKRKRGKQDQRPNKKRQKTESTVQVVNEKANSGVPSGLNWTTTHGAKHHDVLDLNGDHDWFQRTDKCEIVVRESGVRFSPGIQRDVDEVKLNHLKKHSEAVLKSEDTMREAVMKSDLEAKRGRDQLQLQLDMVMARQTMKKEGIPKDEIERAMPLQQLGKD